MNKKFACRYAIVRFQPYAETGEFANVGVVVTCPQTGYFGYKLQKKKYARITSFFSELNHRYYLTAIRAIEGELSRLADSARSMSADELRILFDGITHPREAIIKIEAHRVVLSERPADTLESLFDHYVDHAFVNEEYIETRIARRVGQVLGGLPLKTAFRKQRIGDEMVHANFQFVQHLDDGTPSKVIKPFNLAQDEPNKIFEHGDLWVKKLTRLRQGGHLPAELKLLFAIATTPADDVKGSKAGEAIISDLEALGVRAIDESDTSSLERFAMAE